MCFIKLGPDQRAQAGQLASDRPDLSYILCVLNLLAPHVHALPLQGMGAAWYLDSCELENVATGEKWMFDFKCWLDAKRGLQQTRPPSGYKPPTKGGLSDYRCGWC